MKESSDMGRMDDEIYHAVNRGDLAELREWRPHVLRDMMARTIEIENGVDVESNRLMLEELADMLSAIDRALSWSS